MAATPWSKAISTTLFQLTSSGNGTTVSAPKAALNSLNNIFSEDSIIISNLSAISSKHSFFPHNAPSTDYPSVLETISSFHHLVYLPLFSFFDISPTRVNLYSPPFSYPEDGDTPLCMPSATQSSDASSLRGS